MSKCNSKVCDERLTRVESSTKGQKVNVQSGDASTRVLQPRCASLVSFGYRYCLGLGWVESNRSFVAEGRWQVWDSEPFKTGQGRAGTRECKAD
jgi:hypothetical protein